MFHLRCETLIIQENVWESYLNIPPPRWDIKINKEQNFELKGEIKIKIQYDLKKDKSTIIMREPKEEKIKEVKAGLVILYLNTNKGDLEANY